MSAVYEEWAERVAGRYEDISLQDYTFWNSLTEELEGYSKSFNSYVNQQFLTFERSSPNLVVLGGPMVTMRLFLDPITKKLYYAFSSRLLADLAQSHKVPATTGSVRLVRGGYYPRLECIPPLLLNHFSHDLNLNELPNEVKRAWPLHDALARCLIEKVLDADSFDKAAD